VVVNASCYYGLFLLSVIEREIVLQVDGCEMLQVRVPLMCSEGKAWLSLVRLWVRSMLLEIVGDQKVAGCCCQRYTALPTILCTPTTHLSSCFGQLALALVRFTQLGRLAACSGRCLCTNQCYNHEIFMVQKRCHEGFACSIFNDALLICGLFERPRLLPLLVRSSNAECDQAPTLQRWLPLADTAHYEER
jgi:hypothetical protein